MDTDKGKCREETNGVDVENVSTSRKFNTNVLF
jgi:hypothetical protein